MPNLDFSLLTRLVFCFLLGSIPFAVVAMAGTGIDIRKVGSGNPGFNNVLRVSKTRAILTLIGDMGKGILAVWLCLRPGDPALLGWVYGFVTVLGHCYTPWLGFKGGKGVATSGGVMLMLYPQWALVALAFFVVARIGGSRRKWKEAGAIASIATWVVFSGLLLALVGWREAGVAALMTLFLTWRHQQNFRNLLAGVLLVVLASPTLLGDDVLRMEDGIRRKGVTYDGAEGYRLGWDQPAGAAQRVAPWTLCRGSVGVCPVPYGRGGRGITSRAGRHGSGGGR